MAVPIPATQATHFKSWTILLICKRVPAIKTYADLIYYYE